MAKARRRLSDLVHEETQKIREPNLQTTEVAKSESLSENPSEAEDQITDLQTSEMTNSEGLLETPSEVEDKVTEQQTTKVTDLRTLEMTNSVTLSESKPLSKTDSTAQQTAKVTDLQTLEAATNSEGLLETPRQVEDKVTELQTSGLTKSVTLPKSSSEVEKRVTEQQASNVTDLQTNKYSESVSSMQIAIEREGEEVNKTTKLQSSQDTDLQSTEFPKYLKLERKEARLRQDQIDALTDLTRKLNRTKQVKGGERLTDNTLIRVAVDLLLSKASELQGTTEDELRSSLNL